MLRKNRQTASRIGDDHGKSSRISLKDCPSPKDWQKLVQTFPEANFLQSEAWGEVNRRLGHKVERKIFLAATSAAGSAPTSNPPTSAACQFIIKSAKRGRYLEIPGGPLLDWSDSELVKTVFTELAKISRAEHCVFIRCRPQLSNTPKNRQIFTTLGFRPAPMHLHAEHTVMINLKNSEEKLLGDLRRQTRYDVRRAAKLGITVKKSADAALFREFHTTQTATAARQHFIPPTLRELLAEHAAFGDNAVIYIAKTAAQPVQESTNFDQPNSEPIAYGLILKFGREADYFEAASTELNRKLPGAHALIWQAIRDLKQEGFERFNLWGIAPEGQPRHRYAKVTTFKTGFGGELINFVPAQDLVLNKTRYAADLLIESARKKWRHL